LLNVHSRLEAVNYLMQHPELLAVSEDEMIQIRGVSPLNSRNPNSLAILVVDDNARYRRQLIKMISNISPGSRTYEAENTQQAVVLTQQTQPRLVLIDVVLGNENGINCVRQLKRLSTTTRIILFSAYPDSEFHRLGLEAGAIAFLDKKNLDMASLRQILEDVGLH
jgi:CheY-like chemotaxis protein